MWIMNEKAGGLAQEEMKNNFLLGEMKKKPDDCTRFENIAGTIYKGNASLVAKYLMKLVRIHKPLCKETVAHTIINL